MNQKREIEKSTFGELNHNNNNNNNNSNTEEEIEGTNNHRESFISNK